MISVTNSFVITPLAWWIDTRWTGIDQGSEAGGFQALLDQVKRDLVILKPNQILEFQNWLYVLSKPNWTTSKSPLHLESDTISALEHNEESA